MMDLATTMKWIARWEEGPKGPALTAYTDTMGHPTVGIGFNLDRPDAPQKITAMGLNYQQVRAGQQSLTLDQINQLFAADVNTAIASAASIVPGFDALPDAAQMVITDMIFNLGPRGFAGFARAISAFENKNWEMAALEMTQSAWYAQTGQRSKGDVEVIRQLAVSGITLTPPGPGANGGGTSS
ncbi:MAG TPA: glycoside hydrolase family protein [Terriglobia bacterium]|nr:glycoside hydrolase family protein [Terriglobia bacterium]